LQKDYENLNKCKDNNAKTAKELSNKFNELKNMKNDDFIRLINLNNMVDD